MLEVLVSTPDRGNHENLKRMFEKLGLKVSVLSSLQATIDYLSVRDIDLVFCCYTQLSTPRPELIQQLNQITTSQKIPLIIMATHEERNRMRSSLPFHSAEQILKPVTPEELSKTVHLIRPGEFNFIASKKTGS